MISQNALDLVRTDESSQLILQTPSRKKKPPTRIFSDGSGTRKKRVSEVPPLRNGFQASRTRLFLFFCQIFAIFDNFSVEARGHQRT